MPTHLPASSVLKGAAHHHDGADDVKLREWVGGWSRMSFATERPGWLENSTQIHVFVSKVRRGCSGVGIGIGALEVSKNLMAV